MFLNPCSGIQFIKNKFNGNLLGKRKCRRCLNVYDVGHYIVLVLSVGRRYDGNLEEPLPCSTG